MVYDIHIFVCTNERKNSEKLSCGEAQGLELVGEFKKQLKDLKINLKTRTSRSGCLGICDFGPTVAIYPEGTFYVNVQKTDVSEIIDAHLVQHKKVDRLLLKQNTKEEVGDYLIQENIFELFKHQLEKDFESSGCKAGFIAALPFGFEKIKEVVKEQLEAIIKSSPNLLPVLLYRIDISELQLKNYQTKHPLLEFEEALSEILIKRVLQKVIIKKSFSNK